MATARDSVVEFLRPRPSTLRVALVLLHLEAGLLLGYALFGSGQFDSLWDWRFAIYPFFWLNVGLWALWRTDPPESTRRRRLLAAGVAVGYLLVLGYVGGLFSFSASQAVAPALSTTLPPGWSPTFTVSVPPLRVSLFPYRVVGYLALSYLVYATVLDAAGSAVGGLLGLFSCVSCTWPILATVATGIFGSASAVAVLSSGYAYGLSTVVFVVTVGLLAWRPTLSR